jgi:N,N-dimethylformamidase
MLKIVGYPDRYSVAPGEKIAFKISLEEGTHFDARLVRVVHGDCNPEGPGLKFRHVKSDADGRHKGRPQRIDAGSYATVDDFPALAVGAFTFFAMIWPTLPKRSDQTLLAQWDGKTQSGFRIAMTDGGKLSVTLADGSGKTAELKGDHAMLERQWYAIAVSIDPATGMVTLDQRPIQPYARIVDRAHASARLAVSAKALDAPLFLAGCPARDGTIGRHFDGKIDGPLILRGIHTADEHDLYLRPVIDPALLQHIIARWDFSRDIRTTRIVDIGPSQYHGRIVHLPARGMKGWNWTGEEHSWTRKPEHYGAIHFHSDDVYDAGWETSVEVTIPADIKSGPYALHVKCGENDRELTRAVSLAFFVRPPRRRKDRQNRPKVLVLASTASYIAYANHGEHITARGAERQMGRLLQFGHTDLYMYDHPELGGSLYDIHTDGSGVCYSSRLRPNLNFSPQYHSWLGGHGSGLYQYNADTHLYDWLDHRGVDYDLITDEDLHEDGYELLRDYRVVVTGTHPEYHSTPMWDAMKAWIDRGGRLMYMGGNGWYWRIAYHDELPGVIEVRRAEDGIRTWAAEPGEYHHSFTGEFGGLWRRIGRAPNVICGVGFIAQGFDVSSYYRRAPDADNPRAQFIFKDVPDEIIGDFGLIGGGASGIELDCITTNLGSPPNMLRLATSENHNSMMLLVNEEFTIVPPSLGGDQNERVRADLSFGETPSGGALFATSSIAWCGSLSHNNYDNNVSKICWNVLERFVDPKPFSSAD